jgi:hypothetical protein
MVARRRIGSVVYDSRPPAYPTIAPTIAPTLAPLTGGPPSANLASQGGGVAAAVAALVSPTADATGGLTWRQ